MGDLPESSIGSTGNYINKSRGYANVRNTWTLRISLPGTLVSWKLGVNQIRLQLSYSEVY